MNARTRHIVACFFALLFAIGAACSKKSDDSDEAGQKELPPLTFNDDTPELMLTWIDERGDTHVEQSTRRIPRSQAGFVRVVIADQDQRDPIYVADVTKPDATGSYSAHGIPRARWEEEIAKRRREGSALANAPDPQRAPRPRERERERQPSPSPMPAPPPNHEHEAPAPPLDPSMSSVKVIVYGASWCQACHKAVEHVKRKGVQVELRDIEKDKSAAAEMKTKLDRVARARGSIPVIDVAGQILVGYSPRDLDRALDKARGGTML